MKKAFKVNVNKPNRIIIVGAGLAGLSAAYYLLKNSKKKIDVTILESTDRVGGRVKTIEFNNVFVDTGGFMIFKWYKHFFKLIKNLGLSDHLVPFEVKEYYEFKGKLTSYNKLPKCVWDKGMLVCKTFPYLLLGKFNVYNPDLNVLKNKRVSDFVSEKSKLHEILSILISGYTYPSINDWPTPLFLSMAWKMKLNGLFNGVSQFAGGTEILIRDLKQEVLNYGGKIKINQKVVGYKKRTIETIDKKYIADNIIFACTLDDKLFHNVLRKKIDYFYTKNRMVLVEFEKKIKIDNKKDWTIVYRKKGTGDIEVVSIVNIPKMTNSLNSNFVVMYINVNGDEDNINKKLLRVINKQTKEMFNDNKAKKIHYIENWDKTMPDITAESLNYIKEHEGKSSCYFIGDYTSWSSMEVAVYSGEKVASEIIKKHNL